jgi:hypothetical protein
MCMLLLYQYYVFYNDILILYLNRIITYRNSGSLLTELDLKRASSLLRVRCYGNGGIVVI